MLRSRIKEFRRVRAADIRGVPWNFRRHPAAQLTALAESMDGLGFLDPLDLFEGGDGLLYLLDGHARRDLINARVGPDTLIPCNITDLSEAEAKKAMLLKDPLSALAQADEVALASLTAELEAATPAAAAALDGLSAGLGGAAATLPDSSSLPVICPHCAHEFEVPEDA